MLGRGVMCTKNCRQSLAYEISVALPKFRIYLDRKQHPQMNKKNVYIKIKPYKIIVNVISKIVH